MANNDIIERPIGDVFYLRGERVFLKVSPLDISAKDCCDGCFLYKPHALRYTDITYCSKYEHIIGECGKNMRNDKHGIIFKECEAKPKPAPCISCNGDGCEDCVFNY